jgi:UDP-2,4-diacetamido-2,4,6-trideoxy-beta-L-altropyranose hydrolase
MKTILFRADSSSTIGTGHIMRDLVLAEQYPESQIIFATQNLEGNLNSKILESGYEVQNLDSNDVNELIELVKKLSVDMVIVDHYGIDYTFEKTLKEKTAVQLMVFDDTYKKHYCDILLNHNISGDTKKYQGLVPKECELRCGAKYTLLREEFIEEKNKKTIFLAMGGADHSNINIPILEVFKEFSNIEVNLVTTTSNQHLKKLKEYVQDKKWIDLHINSNKIAKLMRISDFAIVTPSVTLNEVLFMELPFIAIQTASNQKDIAEYLRNNNYLLIETFNTCHLKKYLIKVLK